MPARILCADYVLPITSDPIERGAVAIDADSIVAVGSIEQISGKFRGVGLQDFGKAAIIPGLVNCHSHLEITALRGLLDGVENDFRSWLLKLSGARARLSAAEIEVSAIAGAVEGARAGVTCFGDIGRFGIAGVNALKSVGLRGVVFQETEFSSDDRTADDDFEKLHDKFLGLRDLQTGLVEAGISPHAPYTVSSRLFERIAAASIDDDIKITIHAAESLEEHELLTSGTGFFIEVYKKFGVEWQSPHCSPIEFLEMTGILRTAPLLAHCVKVSGRDISLIAESGSKVAHCPKSNAKFGHGSSPVERLIDAGILVGLGSDSVASNNICDILEEARFAAFAARNRDGRDRFFSAGDGLEMATLGGATALGLESRIGSLEPGKQADLAVISLTELSQLPVHDIAAALVFSSGRRDIVMTMVAGNEIYRDGRVIKVDEVGLKRQLEEIGTKLTD